MVFQVIQAFFVLVSMNIFFSVVTVYATLGEEAVAYAMKECDAVAVFTTFGLLEKVNAAVKDCPSIVHVIYYPDLHQRSDEPQKADASLEKLFTDIDRNLYDFETLLDMGESGGIFFSSIVCLEHKK